MEGCGFLTRRRVIAGMLPAALLAGEVFTRMQPADAQADPKQAAALDAGVRAFTYGLPVVLLDVTMKQATNVARPRGFTAPVNQFAHVRAFPTADFKGVVRANVDTLYSSAFLDLSREPMVLSVPDTRGHYYLMPMLDAWSNIFASPGTRTTGSGAGSFVITGPGWDGPLPGGVQRIASQTNYVWILGRTQANGQADLDAVHAFQDGYALVPLSAFGKPYTAPVGTVDPAVDMKTPPIDQLRAMDATAYFGALARLLKPNPPPASEAPTLAQLAKIGIVPGRPFDPARLDQAVAAGLQSSISVALDKLREASHSVSKPVNGWQIPPLTLGKYGADYGLRAVIALIAYGANLAADAVYPTTFLDADGKALSGASRYTLHFAKGATPPVNAFWSITMYDPQSFFVANPTNRYAVSSWMPLIANPDGSIDIYIQHDSPGVAKEANWLPAPSSEFNVTLRMYWPKTDAPSILDGTWKPPAVTRAV
jgi:hypothetical protein